MLPKYRSSSPKVFCKNVFKASNFIEKESLAQVFSCEFFEIPKNTFFYRTPSVAASKNSKLKEKKNLPTRTPVSISASEKTEEKIR